ncbi:MAG: hypothetical protein R3C05_05300 [Pirellulaceae bacterium]
MNIALDEKTGLVDLYDTVFANDPLLDANQAAGAFADVIAELERSIAFNELCGLNPDTGDLQRRLDAFRVELNR